MFGLVPSHVATHALPLIAGMSLATAIAVVVGLGMQYRSRLEAVLHTEGVKGSLTQVFSLVQDGELGRRGYLLTGEEAYARRTDHAHITFDVRITSLQALTADDADQQAALVELRDLAIPRFVTDNAGGAFSRPGELADGVASLDPIRVIAERMVQRQEVLLKQRQTEAESTGGFLILGTFAAVLLAWFSLSIWTHDRRKSASDSARSLLESGNAAHALQESRSQTSAATAGRKTLEAQV